MKDRRLGKSLRSVARALDPAVSDKADSFSLLQSIAAKCGVTLGDDGAIATFKQLQPHSDISLVRQPHVLLLSIWGPAAT